MDKPRSGQQAMMAAANPAAILADGVTHELAPDFDLAVQAARRRQRIEQMLSLFSPLILLALWEVAAQLRWIDLRFFPAPSQIAVVFFKMVMSGEYFKALQISFARIAVGFLMGAIPALILGVLMGLSSIVRAAFSPIIGALLPIPKLALLPLILLIFGIGESAKWVTIASGVFFYVLYDTLVGVSNIDRVYLDVAKAYGAPTSDFWFRVALPGALPMIFNGLKLGLAVGLLLIVAAEMIGANEGIGFLIWMGYSVFDLERMYVGLLTMAVLGYIITQGLDALEKKVIPWKR
ncbi:MAG: ABC transporter permease [Anaerolineae bacterium]